MDKPRECQIPNLPTISTGPVYNEPLPAKIRFKRKFAKIWNYILKPQVRKSMKTLDLWTGKAAPEIPCTPSTALKEGDLVRVKPREEIEPSLDRWKELKGCAFLEYMWQYCGTSHRVLKVMERFLDEKDYKVKKCKGIVLLDGVICHGTPAFGRCDRCCHLFWRVEWLEKIDG
jgi:hypothetical protein